ncbi:MAG TPA: tRNA glutamyl-Q(34) synthetase GluQRS [Rhodocyclaceae bacterium]|nr:tRNA glutamyl-Q(34) synthetase GluQRS [Rhodocyclaceae bacterium]
MIVATITSHPPISLYCGRFAPSPTGPLHFGSLLAAVGSYLDARSCGGVWRVRMEDVDRPRCNDEAADAILRMLEVYGFEWDGEVMYQSRRDAAYRAAFDRLCVTGRVFPCACTRRELADSQTSLLAGDGALVYPGTCRNGLPPGRAPRTWRLRVDDAQISFDDRIQGHIEQNLASEAGDFVLLRADELFAYQLAVVVDDAEQGITHVVRGADLLDSTPRQILLQQLLGMPTPLYAHLPVIVDMHGEKLSKQTLAAPLMIEQAQSALLVALALLGQAPLPQLCDASLGDLWQWAQQHWDLAKVPHCRALPAAE